MGASIKTNRNKGKEIEGDEKMPEMTQHEIVMYVTSAIDRHKKSQLQLRKDGQVFKQNLDLPNDVLLELFKSLGMI